MRRHNARLSSCKYEDVAQLSSGQFSSLWRRNCPVFCPIDLKLLLLGLCCCWLGCVVLPKVSRCISFLWVRGVFTLQVNLKFSSLVRLLLGYWISFNTTLIFVVKKQMLGVTFGRMTRPTMLAGSWLERRLPWDSENDEISPTKR